VEEAGYATVAPVNGLGTGGARIVGEEGIVPSTNLIVEVVVEDVELLLVAHLRFLKDDAGGWLLETPSHEMAIDFEAVQVAGCHGEG
jgi:hypothetical protein